MQLNNKKNINPAPALAGAIARCREIGNGITSLTGRLIRIV